VSGSAEAPACAGPHPSQSSRGKIVNPHRKIQAAAKAILAIALAAGACDGFSAPTQEARALSVTATIQGNCVLTTTPMAFGNLNMSGTATEEQASSTVNYKCANGVTVGNFSVGGSNTGLYSGAMLGLSSGNTDTIPFTITWTEPASYTGTGFGAPGQTVTLLGHALYEQYKSKQPGNYATTAIVAVDY